MEYNFRSVHIDAKSHAGNKMRDALVLDECYNLIPHNRFQRSTTLIGFIKAERKTLRSMTGKRTSLALNGLLCSFLSRLSKLNNA